MRVLQGEGRIKKAGRGAEGIIGCVLMVSELPVSTELRLFFCNLLLSPACHSLVG